MREELKSAAGKSGGDPDESIHEIRKHLKRTRGVLRLVEGELGKEYDVEAGVLREIGQTLSSVRDASAIIETFDELADKYSESPEAQHFATIRRGLMKRKLAIEKHEGVEAVLTKIRADLWAARERVTAWPLEKDGFPALRTALKKTLRRGKERFAHAKKHPESENFHAWRKSVKEHWYQIQLLEGLWDDGMPKYEKRLKKLGNALGTDHNLQVLREQITNEAVLKLIDKYQNRLRERCLVAGERIYRCGATKFVHHVETLWDAWAQSA